MFQSDTQGLNFRKAFQDVGFRLSGYCIWKKNALVLERSPYQWYSDRKQTTIWKAEKVN